MDFEAARDLELREAAHALDVNPSRIQQWLAGRSLKVRPSVQRAKHTGIRNVFSVQDLYLMGVATELLDIGVPAPKVQKLILSLTPREIPSLKAIILLRDPEWDMLRVKGVPLHVKLAEVWLKRKKVVTTIVVDVGRLMEKINSRLREV